MKGKTLIWIALALLAFSSCRDKELDMTLVQKTVFQDATVTAVSAKDAWNVVVVQDEETFVELEYSAFLEDYLQVTMEGEAIHIGFIQHLYL